MTTKTLELNIALAKKLGYTVYENDDAHPPYYVLHDQNEDAVVPSDYSAKIIGDRNRGQRASEELAWADCPDFVHDYAKLIELLGDRQWQITHLPPNHPSASPNEFMVSITPPYMNSPTTIVISSPDLGEAIVEAILQLDFEAESRQRQHKFLEQQIERYRQEKEALETTDPWLVKPTQSEGAIGPTGVIG